jgi:hypothetical protein
MGQTHFTDVSLWKIPPIMVLLISLNKKKESISDATESSVKKET